MQLDVQTLSVVTVFVTALLGILLVFAGMQNHNVRAPMVWGAAYLLSALGQLIGSQALVTSWVASVANAMILLGAAGVWAGTRFFDGRPVRPIPVVAAPAFWGLACLVPSFGSDPQLRIVLMSTLMAMLTAATAEEVWRGRAEPLMSRWPTVCALLAYAAALLARIPAALLSPLLQGQSLMSGISFALLAFGTLLFTVVLAFLLLNMSKERSELKHKIASMIDPLSGVPNRRAFLEGAERLQNQQRLDQEPLAVLLFDLDRFKMINDDLGHAAGDTVLQLFASTATSTLGGDVLFGRIGGEEFAAMLPVGDGGEAAAIADRVRRKFEGAASSYAAADVQPTVSVGFTIGWSADQTVSELLGAADQALYRAKANGRNRVEMQDAPEQSAASTSRAGAGRRQWRKAAATA
jgi:diguanylate cyclase (GGDEF)-like protein